MRDWYFTFSQHSKWNDAYVKITGKYKDAKAEMNKRFPGKWVAQFISYEHAQIDEKKLREIK